MTRLSLFCLLIAAACSAPSPGLIQPGDIEGDRLLAPLTNIAGDPIRGRTVFSEREQGHCVLCHVVDGLDVPFQGDVGPDLSHVADRLDAGQLRLRIVDYQIVRPGALMPSYYRNHDLYQVEDTYADQTILSPQNVEDLVAYLSGLEHDEDE